MTANFWLTEVHCLLQFGRLLHLVLLSIRTVLLWNSGSGLGLVSAILPDILKRLNLNSREGKYIYVHINSHGIGETICSHWVTDVWWPTTVLLRLSVESSLVMQSIKGKTMPMRQARLWDLSGPSLYPYTNSNSPAMYNLKYRAKSILCDLIEKLWRLCKSWLSWGHHSGPNDQHCDTSFPWKKKSLGELHLVKNVIWGFDAQCGKIQIIVLIFYYCVCIIEHSFCKYFSMISAEEYDRGHCYFLF